MRVRVDMPTARLLGNTFSLLLCASGHRLLERSDIKWNFT